MKLFKVLNENLKSPFQNFQYEIGKEYVCENFDDSDSRCSYGFYATELEGLPYTLRKGLKVFEVEVSGKNKKFDQYKWRWERQKILREVQEDELKNLLRNENEKMKYNLLEVCYPVNPLELKPKEVTETDIENLKKWASVGDFVGASVRASAGDSVRASVWDSVWASVRDSVWASVGDSVWASVWAYISSLFPSIKKWKYVEHEEGENPFQPCIDLWHAGFIPSHDGNIWRLHSGKDAKVVYEYKGGQ